MVNYVLIISILLIITFIGIILFYPVGKNRCMKSAKDSNDWCVDIKPATDDGSCLRSDPFRRRNISSEIKIKEFYADTADCSIANDPNITLTPKDSNVFPSGFTGLSDSTISNFGLSRGSVQNILDINMNATTPDGALIHPWQNNHQNNGSIGNPTRMMRALHPEFSWLSNGRRVYKKFACDISRIGYTNEGRVTALICPQVGNDAGPFGHINIEVTVTKVRGFVDETKLPQQTIQLTSDQITPEDAWINSEFEVVVQAWFPEVRDTTKVSPTVTKLLNFFERFFGATFPSSKANAIKVSTTDYATRGPNLLMKAGLNPDVPRPEFTEHDDVCGSCYVSAWCAEKPKLPVLPSNASEDDKFNRAATGELHQSLLDIVNIAGHDILKGALNWNLYATCPEKVDMNDWERHRDVWQHSILTPTGVSHSGVRTDMYEDGTPLDKDMSYTDYLRISGIATELLARLTVLKARKSSCRNGGRRGFGCLN